MSFGDNTVSPFEIQDGRKAAVKASENQRAVEDRLKSASRELAQAERAYRVALSKRTLELRAGTDAIPALAATVCETVARGEEHVANLRFERDVKAGIFEATKQEAFSRGADRRDLDTLLNWSMRRDLATQQPPVEYPRPVGAAAA